VALSANAVRGEADKARALGVDVYLTKPTLLKDLRKALQRFLPDVIPPAADADKGAVDTGAEGDVPVFDVSALVSLVGDDPKILGDVLSDYRRMTGKLAADLSAAVADGNAARIGAIAHRLKSSSRSVGALRLGEICVTLEEAGKAAAFDTIATCMVRLTAALAEVQAHILDHFERNRKGAPPGAGPDADTDR
jgi:two-component system sensor histidine kinase/response regulator